MKTVISFVLVSFLALAQTTPPGGGRPLQVSVDGASYSAAPKLYLAPGSGMGAYSISCSGGVCTVTLNASAGAGTGDVLGAASISGGQVAYGSGTAGTITTNAGLAFNASTGLGVIRTVTTGQAGTQSGKVTFQGTTSGSASLEVSATGTKITSDKALEAPSLIVTGSGASELTAIAMPGTTPDAGTGYLILDSTTKRIATKNDAAVVTNYAPTADPVFTGSLNAPNGTGPTVDAAGEVAVDTSTDQFQFYGGAKRALPSIKHVSFVIPAPVATDDFILMKAPYGMTILAIKGVLAGTTNVVGQLQECDSSGASCADLDSDITFNGGEDSDDGTLTDSTITSGNWIAWKTTSISGTPTFLTVTVTYRVVPD
jgi:hypothetical protein